jgi:hypothetical protein
MRSFDQLNPQASASQHNGVYVPFSSAGVPVVKTLARLDPTFSTKMAPVLTVRATLFKRHLLMFGSFRNPKMTPRLPQELVDRIVDFVAIRERDTVKMVDLKSCSLTAKSWTRASRRHFPNAITIHSFDRFFDWASEIDLASDISSRMRTITLHDDHTLARRFSPEGITKLKHNLTALYNLECLNLRGFDLHSGTEHAKLILELLDSFGGKLNTLNLDECSLSPNAFQSILHLFPHLDNVSIGNDCSPVINSADDSMLKQPPDHADKFRGSLVTGTNTLQQFLPCLLTVPLHFRRLVCALSKDGHEIISACAATLQVLYLEGTFSFTSFLELSRLTQLLFW